MLQMIEGGKLKVEKVPHNQEWAVSQKRNQLTKCINQYEADEKKPNKDKINQLTKEEIYKNEAQLRKFNQEEFCRQETQIGDTNQDLK